MPNSRLKQFRPRPGWGWREHQLCIDALKRGPIPGEIRSEISPAVSAREGEFERFMVQRAMRIAASTSDGAAAPEAASIPKP